jgi:hypothetical protein
MQHLNETTEYTHDKTDWPKGEWSDEPDKITWSVIINNYEYKCVIRRVFVSTRKLEQRESLLKRKVWDTLQLCYYK